jgi:hypothetical protein
VLVGRPALMVLGRTVAVAKVGEEGARAWETHWAADARFRRGITVLSAVWGLGLAADAAVVLVLTYTLPIDLVQGVTTVVWYAGLGLLLAFHLAWTRRRDLRA